MSTTESWTIPGSAGEAIHGTTHIPGRAGRTALLLCHGFKGYKDYGFLPHLAEQAAERGFLVHRFNFSHSGMTRRLEVFERPDLFERDTWGRQIEDLRCVAAAVSEGALPGGSPARLAFFGHSRGGATALLTAARAFAPADYTMPAEAVPAPAAVVTAAAPDHACNLDDTQRETLRRAGRLPVPSNRTGQTLYVGRSWLEELEQKPAEVDPVRAAARLACPLRVLHGDGDTTVPPEAADRIGEAAGARARVLHIPEAGHTFDSPNPLPRDAVPAATTRMVEEAIGFL